MTPRALTIALLDEIQDGFNKQDVEAILSHFADDCVWLMARCPMALGRLQELGQLRELGRLQEVGRLQEMGQVDGHRERRGDVDQAGQVAAPTPRVVVVLGQVERFPLTGMDAGVRDPDLLDSCSGITDTFSRRSVP